MTKRPRPKPSQSIVNVWQREVGELSTRGFAHRICASADLVLRLDLHRELDKHRGNVNSVSFNADGDILVSGSYGQAILWNWETGQIKLAFHSGHDGNVFQANFMRYTDNRSIVTCGSDGQIRLAQFLERGVVETTLLGKHGGRAHELAVEPAIPHTFYTCGEDGSVQHFDLRTKTATKLFTCRRLNSHMIRYMRIVFLHTIAIDPRNPNYFAVGGADEFARLYDISKYKCDASDDFGQPVSYFSPQRLSSDWQVEIGGLAFSDQSELLVSYGKEFIYLFTQDMGLSPDRVPSLNKMESSTAASPSVADDHEKVIPQVYKGHKHNVNCVEPHPHIAALASSGIENDIKIWTTKAIDRAVLPLNIERVCSLLRRYCV